MTRFSISLVAIAAVIYCILGQTASSQSAEMSVEFSRGLATLGVPIGYDFKHNEDGIQLVESVERHIQVFVTCFPSKAPGPNGGAEGVINVANAKGYQLKRFNDRAIAQYIMKQEVYGKIVLAHNSLVGVEDLFCSVSAFIPENQMESHRSIAFISKHMDGISKSIKRGSLKR